VSNIDQTSGSASLDKTSLPSDINPNRKSTENDTLNTQRLNGQANRSDVRQLNSSLSNTGTGMLPAISLVSADAAPVNAPTGIAYEIDVRQHLERSETCCEYDRSSW
jgi:hypothetical protein